jgi:hypothetical protein
MCTWAGNICSYYAFSIAEPHSQSIVHVAVLQICFIHFTNVSCKMWTLSTKKLVPCFWTPYESIYWITVFLNNCDDTERGFLTFECRWEYLYLQQVRRCTLSKEINAGTSIFQQFKVIRRTVPRNNCSKLRKIIVYSAWRWPTRAKTCSDNKYIILGSFLK